MALPHFLTTGPVLPLASNIGRQGEQLFSADVTIRQMGHGESISFQSMSLSHRWEVRLGLPCSCP